MAFFLDPNPDCVVECLKTCCSESYPPRFPPIRSGDYMEERFKLTSCLPRIWVKHPRKFTLHKPLSEDECGDLIIIIIQEYGSISRILLLGACIVELENFTRN
ncbi:uncharacterized protein LOC111381735 [Olea europaea var. sylvestris]|uniref:uncharacterized protein LOC111381735 n=1 Tax=Olea europaea var. sylvestris TaxID=158386 RepID=UPI000C1CDF3A|nr:uncharacterized protein LOC111381735 [Olea europaea var. sylvestris]